MIIKWIILIRIPQWDHFGIADENNSYHILKGVRQHCCRRISSNVSVKSKNQYDIESYLTVKHQKHLLKEKEVLC